MDNADNAAFVANLSRAIAQGTSQNSQRMVFNLSGLINECAKQDHNLLDESITSMHDDLVQMDLDD